MLLIKKIITIFKSVNKINQYYIKKNIRTRELSQHVSAAYSK